MISAATTAGINSMAAYYKHNMELIEKTVRDELFGARDIYTKGARQRALEIRGRNRR